MGWDSARGASRHDVIREILAGWQSPSTGASCAVVAIYATEKICWTVEDHVDDDGLHSRRIICHLLEPFPNGWGRKSMGEEMGPFYWDCPLSMLDLAPVVRDPVWRAQVREYHRDQLTRAIPIGGR